MKEAKQLQLVTFEQAKRLKELEFDWEVLDFYYMETDPDDRCGEISTHPVQENLNKWEGQCSAPTVALALKWFRDVKKSIYLIEPYIGCGISDDDDLYVDYSSDCRIDINDEKDIVVKNEENPFGFFDYYEAAESALLDELLTLL